MTLIGQQSAELSTLRARVEELEREVARCHARLEIDHAFRLGDNDEFERFDIPMDERASFPDAVAARDETVRILDANVEAAEARLSEATRLAVEALGPFAKEAAEWSWKFSDEQKTSCRPGPPHDEDEVAEFTVGDLRRARTALDRLTNIMGESNG